VNLTIFQLKGAVPAASYKEELAKKGCCNNRNILWHVQKKTPVGYIQYCGYTLPRFFQPKTSCPEDNPGKKNQTNPKNLRMDPSINLQLGGKK